MFTAICSFGDKEQWEMSKKIKAMTVSGIGKYSHLAIRGVSTIFDFGQVFVGKNAELKFVLENQSAVDASFKIQRSEKETDPCFDFSVLSGIISSKKSLEISVIHLLPHIELFMN